MKKASKAIAFAMASAMAVSMAACGGSASSTASGAASGDSASATGNGSYDQITYAYATFNNIPTEEDLDVVEEEINKITREKIGAEITLKPISIADYVNKVSLSLQGGEKIDVYQSLGNFGNMTVQDLYTTDTFKSRCDLARTWYNEGLIMKDAATTTSTAAECMSSGNYFGYIAAYSYPEADTAASLQAQCGGFELGAKMIGDAYLGTGDINAVSWMIASTTDVPEAALKFLNLTYTDKDIVNLLIYGIEGRDYIMNDDGTVSYPEGEDSTTVPYTAQLSCGTLGNFFIMYPTAGTDPASLEWEQKQNEEAKTSPAMGFTFDSSKLNTQYTAVKNAISQYLPGLLCGSVDPNTELAKFDQALQDAGYQDILNAKQEQLDAWKAAQ